MLEGGDAIAANYQIVMDREHDADDVTREVLIAVRRTFITPFDRGNIRDLITSMDNSIDQMQKTAKAILLFDVTAVHAADEGHGGRHREMRASWCRRACRCCNRSAPRPARISDLTAQISALEGRADEMHDSGLHELYQDQCRQERPGIFRRQRGLRPSGKGGRPLRRRRQRDARHRHRARVARSVGRTMDAVALALPLLVGADRRRAGVRLPQRPARRRQLDRHHRLDPRAAAAIRGGLGGVLQLHRLPVLRAARRRDDRHAASSRRRHRSRA